MTTRQLLILSHLLVAFIATGIAELSPIADRNDALACSVVCATVLSIAFSWWCTARIRRGLRLIENAIEKGERLEGNSEFHKSAAKLHVHVQRWVDSATTGRQKAREVEAVLASVDRHGTGPDDLHDASQQLRMVLASVGREAHETLKQLINCNGEIYQIGQKLSKGAQQQSDTALKATRDIERLSEDIGTIEKTTTLTQQAVKSAQETAASASEVVLQLHSYSKHHDLQVYCTLVHCFDCCGYSNSRSCYLQDHSIRCYSFDGSRDCNSWTCFS